MPGPDPAGAPDRGGTPRAEALRPRADLAALAFLGVAWAALWTLTIPVGDFPLNDDWVYALAVRSILETGRFTLPSPASANVVAQAYWGALFCLPFGFSFTALRVSTFVLGAAGVLALYMLLRELGARRRVALVGALALAVNPIYLELATTFMTDVPFTAVVTASLWLYVRGARRGGAAATGGAVALAFVAILIRQFALVLPLAFGAAHVARRGARRGTRVRTLVEAALPFVLGVALHVAYERWLVATGRTPLVFAPLAALIPRQAVPFVRRSVHIAAVALPYIGLFMAPLLACLALARRPREGSAGRRASLLLEGLLALSLLALLAAYGAMLPDLNNILMPSGVGPLTVRDIWLLPLFRPARSGGLTVAWAVATALGAWAAASVTFAVARVLAGLARSLRRPGERRAAWPQLLMITVAGAYAAGMLLLGYQDTVFDRYLLPLVPPLAAVLLMANGPPRTSPEQARPEQASREQAWSLVAPGLLLALYAVFSVAATHDYLAWNRARWRATDSLLRAGVAPQRIDGGYEFNGWLLHDAHFKPRPGKSYWWVEDDEYVIASGPLAGYEESGRFGFSRWLGPGAGSVLVLRRAAAPP